MSPKDIPKHEIAKVMPPHLLSYIIFTSGSTGEPKGVMIRRKAVSFFISQFIKSTQVNPTDKWGQFSNIGFDLSVVDIFTCLCGGATLYPIVEVAERLLPSNTIRKHKLTIWHSVPSVIDLMAKADQINYDYLKSLRIMSFCGEPLYPRQIEMLFNATSSLIIFNTYGPTEATLFCTLQELTVHTYKNFCHSTVSIGKPIDGWNIILLGERKDYGEIVIYGSNIGEGYLHNYEETFNRYKQIKDNEKVFRAFYSGDWASIYKGNMYFQCRLDGQVKISGNRVELNDIDCQVREFGVSKCKTIYHEKRLYTFIEEYSDFNEDCLRGFLRERLANYQMPYKIILLSKFPKNINEKTDNIQLLKLLDQYEEDN